ncbi:MAG: hypothetical protein HY842_11090 [Bacteroidetes bacterium]|nr:hypothetical protein [Bacteroidota bacterium]
MSNIVFGYKKSLPYFALGKADTGNNMASTIPLSFIIEKRFNEPKFGDYTRQDGRRAGNNILQTVPQN